MPYPGAERCNLKPLMKELNRMMEDYIASCEQLQRDFPEDEWSWQSHATGLDVKGVLIDNKLAEFSKKLDDCQTYIGYSERYGASRNWEFPPFVIDEKDKSEKELKSRKELAKFFKVR